MGVPVVTAPGTRAISRSAGSLLRAVGLDDWIATDYVELAVKKANGMDALAALRASLRQRVQNSPVMNEAKAARDLEAAYRGVWRKWCKGTDAAMV
jgi:predicted O-linked N-acetylglucosamine transferase (SPINDLY family)